MAAIAITIVSAACSEGPTDEYGSPVTGVKLDRRTINMAVDETLTLAFELLPADAGNKKVSWTSIDPSVATVDATGTITALKEGSTAVTVTTADGNKVDVCMVKVNWLGTTRFTTDRIWTVGEQIWSDAVTATGCQKSRYDGGLTAGPYLSDCRRNAPGYGDLFSWTAAREFADVLCPDGWRIPMPDDFATLDMTLNERGNFNPRQGDFDSRDRYLSALWNGEYGGLADNNGIWYQDTQSYYWTSGEVMDGNGILAGIYMYFGANGLIAPNYPIAKQIGFMLRCVSDLGEEGGEPAGPTIEVTDVELDQTAISIAREESMTLTATVYPENATDKTLFWMSGDTSVATVEEGMVTGIGMGTATIIAITADGGKRATCTVTVTRGAIHPTGITVSPSSAEMKVGTPLQLTALVTPSDAADRSVRWRSSSSIAQVSSTGLVTALAEGTVTITATTVDGSLEDHCRITINACGVTVASTSYRGEPPMYINTKTWDAAKTICATDIGAGWRLPTRTEAECMCRNNVWGGENVPNGMYWSGDEDPDNSANAFVIKFPEYHATSLSKTYSQLVRCVKPL